MDNDETEIIAVAPGQIIFKGDGNYDTLYWYWSFSEIYNMNSEWKW